MHNKRTISFKNFLHIIPDLLILVFFIITVFYCHVIYDYSHILYFSTIFFLFIVITLSVYTKLYRWRKLNQSVSSFIFFFLNILQFCLYIFLISNAYLLRSHAPIYLDNLSYFSQYRYLVLSLASIFLIIIFIIIKFSNYDISYFSFFTYPYLKEEIRKILYTWNYTFIGDLCIKLIDLLYFSFWFRILFFILHFILLYIIRLWSVCLLFYCTFFHGDFTSFKYIIPILFVSWLLSIFNYYFIIFQQGSANYIRSLISATLEDKKSSILGIIKLGPMSQVTFKLTQEALSKGYSDLDIKHLAKEWYIQAELSTYLTIYLKFVNYLNYFILILQIIIWYYITKTFFFPLLGKCILSVSPFFWYRSLVKIHCRPYTTEVRRVLRPYQKDLNKITEGVHKDNHPALVDPNVRNPDNSCEILYEGQPTHGKGSAQNPSYPLHPSKDLQGHNKTQNIVPPTTITYVEERFFESNPIPGSQSFLSDPEVKANLAKCTPREENT